MRDDPVLVRTSTEVISVPADRFGALLERLPATAEGREAEAELGASNRLSEETKKVVVRTLRLWLDDRGVDDLGADLNDLRHELMRDLRIQPWDAD